MSNKLWCLAPRIFLPAAAALALTAVIACAPKPPPSTASASASPAATAAPTPSAATGSPQPAANQAAPIKAISRGNAQYIVRNPAGRPVYDVRSPTVVYNKAADGTEIADFTKPHVIFHAPTGRTVVADSPKAVARVNDKSVVMTGGVRAKTDDGKILTCATLTYDVNHSQIECRGDVVLTNTKTNQSASGQVLITDPDFEHVMLSGSR